MTAGAIPAPSLIPLRPPILGKAKGLVSTSSILIIKRVSGFFLAYWPMDHYYVGVRVTLSFSFPPLPDFLSPPSSSPLYPCPARWRQIDTQTRLELRCDHGEADIYFTIDGSAPDPFPAIGGGRRSTYAYEQPIALPPGKVVVKAMAVAQDRVRASPVVAKQFQVRRRQYCGTMVQNRKKRSKKKVIPSFFHRLVKELSEWKIERPGSYCR